MKDILIIGGGPAGLTAAYELLSGPGDYRVTLFEESDVFGGISKTVAYHGNRMDMGGHRFFSKAAEVNAWWEKLLPVQGAPAKDDILLGRTPPLAEGGPDPERTDEVMLMRRRVSRIYFDGNFYDYPISLKPETFRNMGFVKTVKCGFSALGAMLHKLPEDNLENFYINSFGRELYSMFFEYYTENLWGRHPSEIDASWGAQRTKGLSVMGILKDVFGKVFHVKNREVNTSLIEEFKYPKLGPGQLWEVVAAKVEAMGGTVLKNAQVVGLEKEGSRITAVTLADGRRFEGDAVISSMPIRDLVGGMNDVPAEPARIAKGLPYRDYMTLGVLVKKLALVNKTNMTTVGNIVPDCWVYVQDRSVKMGRFQIYNNWSPYLVKDLENTVWVGLEYFCNEGDAFWSQSEEEFAKLGVEEMLRIGLITDASDVLDTHMEKVKKAYPAYFDTYAEIDRLTAWLDTIENLYCVGRNGQHRYNNLDHSMMTSFEAVKCIREGSTDRRALWSVNTEKEYHEEEKKS
ncbi:MAG: NAD(P)/FAD-dependent oxidoreductase [Oscillospiraceae bacterium]|nr:NAD(P)/FAD-dependent oxidoreductase [Oscillospiraceae bacterium]